MGERIGGVAVDQRASAAPAGAAGSTPPPGPLRGITVVDCSEMVPGPFFTRCLLDLGADVVKVERPARDTTFNVQPATYHALNAGKQIEIVDLKDPAGLAAVRERALAADVFVEGFRPGVMSRLGLGYRELAAGNPRLVYVSVSGFGQSGPLAALPGHDLNYLAESGLLAISGGAAGGPQNPSGLPVGDLFSSLYALSATMAALMQAARGGQGQHLDVAITDCLLHVMNVCVPQLVADGVSSIDAARRKLLNKPAYGAFETADGQWVAVAASEDKFWRALVDALGLDVGDLADAPRPARVAAAERVNAAVAAAVRARPARTVLAVLRARDVPATLVAAPAEVARTAHADARGLYAPGDSVARFPVRLGGAT